MVPASLGATVPRIISLPSLDPDWLSAPWVREPRHAHPVGQAGEARASCDRPPGDPAASIGLCVSDLQAPWLGGRSNDSPPGSVQCRFGAAFKGDGQRTLTDLNSSSRTSLGRVRADVARGVANLSSFVRIIGLGTVRVHRPAGPASASAVDAPGGVTATDVAASTTMRRNQTCRGSSWRRACQTRLIVKRPRSIGGGSATKRPMPAAVCARLDGRVMIRSECAAISTAARKLATRTRTRRRRPMLASAASTGAGPTPVTLTMIWPSSRYRSSVSFLWPQDVRHAST